MLQVHGVVTQFLQVFPELKTAPLVVTGESYGGLYTPNLGHLLLKDPDVNFKALAVGDPCINGQAQWLTYPDTLYGMGVIMQHEREQLRGIVAKSVDNLKAFQAGTGTCRAAFEQWNSIWDDDGHDSGGQTVGLFASMTGSTMTENILMTDSPASFDNHMKWFAKSEVAAAFHITGIEDLQPSDPALGLKVYDAFVDSGDFCTNSSYLYAELLASKEVDLMIYSSTVDPLLGPPTTEGGINAIMADPKTSLELSNRFITANKTLWTAGSKFVAGYSKCTSVPGSQGKRFCYVVVRNAGHMTPAFKPLASAELIGRFLDGVAFDASGNGKVKLPSCAECGGAGPFAGKQVPACACKK